MISVPPEWICPITQTLMCDPVIAPDGHTYERTAIEIWLTTNGTSPLTRVATRIDDLVPNRALRATIDTYRAAHNEPHNVSRATSIMPFVSSPYKVTGKTFVTHGGKKYLHVRVSAPADGPRQPIVLMPIIDNSGSMGESVGGAGGIEDMGFSRLDLVKHAVRSMAAILEPQDLMGLVSFSNEGKVILEPLNMDTNGKMRLYSALDFIHPDSSTNIYDGIKKAAALLADPIYAEMNIVAMLLTDGYPTITPMRGILPNLDLIVKPARWTLHTFGFGYSIDSNLCAQVAKWGGGLFGYIPDATMIGTVFINAISYVLSTACINASFNINTPESKRVNVGLLTYGQPRDYLFEVSGTPLLNDTEVSAGDPEFVYIYKIFMDIIQRAIDVCKAGHINSAKSMFIEFVNMFNVIEDPCVTAYLRDLRAHAEGEGQVGMAPDYFTRWGEHYLRAYLRAQELQQCMNFKDPGLQIYGGALFHRLQDIGDNIFCTIPPPKPSITTRSHTVPPISMSIFHNASGGCFAPETLIKMCDGRHKMIYELKRGDSVWTPSGPANVRALVICGSKNRAQPMTMLNSLVITPYHPVRHHTGAQWFYPADLAGYTDRLVQKVYNLVLDSGHIVCADGWEALTLGHGFTTPIAAHDYFGTQRIIDDIVKQPGWEDGQPTYVNLKAIKDNITGTIVRWIDDLA